MCYLLPLTCISACYALIWRSVSTRRLPGEPQVRITIRSNTVHRCILSSLILLRTLRAGECGGGGKPRCWRVESWIDREEQLKSARRQPFCELSVPSLFPAPGKFMTSTATRSGPAETGDSLANKSRCMPVAFLYLFRTLLVSAAFPTPSLKQMLLLPPDSPVPNSVWFFFEKKSPEVFPR